MADRKEDFRILEPLERRFAEKDDRFSFFIVDDFQVVPRKIGAESRSQSFSNCLFSGKFSGKMGRGILEFITIILFYFRKKTVQEMLAMPFYAGSHAVYFDDIAT
jgi:hypothetical protein